MNTFKKWNNKTMEDDGAYMSKEAKSFYTAFKNYLKRSFPNAELTGFKPNHYDTSGFISQNDKIIYVSHSLFRNINRYCNADFNASDASRGVLYRTATSTHDFTGGHNNFCSINNMVDSINNLFENYERYSV